MSAPKRTPRERLLEYVGGDGSVDYMGEDARKHTRTVRRLLRAHERDLAERAVEAAKDIAPPWEPSRAERIRAAILGPKRGRRA